MKHGLVVAALSLAPLAAQCGLQWQDGVPIGGVGGSVVASLRWDPDGTGPLTPVVVLGGTFAAAGSVAAANIVTWDPATRAFASFGAGLGVPGADVVRALAVGANGELLAGGSFMQSGPTALGKLARWNGTSWSAFGIGAQPITGDVRALAARPNGDIVVGGSMQVFTSATSGVPWLAVWNGTSWQPTAGGGVDGEVLSLVPLPNGELLVTGSFLQAGASTA